MLDQVAKTPLIDIRQVCRSFPKGSGKDVVVLENVDLTIKEGEIVRIAKLSKHRLHLEQFQLSPTFPQQSSTGLGFVVHQ